MAVASSPVPIAFLGAAHSHAFAKAAVVKSLPQYRFAGFWEEQPEAKQKFAAAGIPQLSLSQILGSKEIAVVAVESAVGDHFKHALMALEAGKHVHVEKPPAETLAEFKKLHAAAKSRKLLLQTGYMWRYNPGFEKALEAAREGWLGDVYQIHAAMNTLIPPNRRVEWGQFKGGQMFEHGGYMVDAMVRLLGRPDRVTPFLRKTSRFNDTLLDNTVAVLEFPGATGVIRSATLQPNAARYRAFEIQGTNGTAVLRPVEEPELEIDLLKPAGPYKEGAQKVPLPRYARFQEDFVELAAAIRGERSLTVSLDQELLVHETLMRACGIDR